MQLPTSFLFPKEFKAPDRLSGLPENTPILVGFSGGSDSSVLLFLLALWCQQTGAPLSVAHVNHGIRGEEADRDEAFCRQVTASLGLPFYSCRVDVPQAARESGESIETTARALRYEWFDQVMKEQQIPILATAHNAGDNLETVLFHLARGAGLNGLCGIPEARQTAHGILIRPLLRMEKETVLSLCEAHGIDFVCDRTNTDTDYTRNKIRAQMVPLLREINSGAVGNVSHLCESLHEDSLCLVTMANWFLEEMRQGDALEIEKICGAPPAVVNRALMTLFSDVSGGYTLTYSHITAVRALAAAGIPHSALSLPGGMEAVIEQGRLQFRPKLVPAVIADYEQVLQEGTNTISHTNTEIVIGNSQNTKNVYKNSILLYLDSAKINMPILARKRRAGDKIRCGGMSHSLKKLMNQKKIPLSLRDRIPVLCVGEDILAVPLVAVRDDVRAKENDSNTLCISVSFAETEASAE